MNQINTITEKELVTNTQNNTVQYIEIIEVSEREYNIHASLTWQKNEVVLITQRGHPRTWRSIDRMIIHINNYYATIPLIILKLRSKNNEI